MSRILYTSLLALLFLANTWADDKDDAAKKELEKFQGEWKLVGSDEIKIQFKEGTYEFSGQGTPEKGKMKFNPFIKPAQVDVEIKEGDDAGKTQVGIYRWDGDKVKFCFAQAGEAKRPANFDNEGGDHIIFEFEKVKK